jgi:hypothetical protein
MPFWVEDAEGNIVTGNDVASKARLDQSPADQRKLLESVFTQPGAGVYLTPDGKGGFTYKMVGLWSFTLEGQCGERAHTPRHSE